MKTAQYKTGTDIALLTCFVQEMNGRKKGKRVRSEKTQLESWKSIGRRERQRECT